MSGQRVGVIEVPSVAVGAQSQAQKATITQDGLHIEGEVVWVPVPGKTSTQAATQNDLYLLVDDSASMVGGNLDGGPFASVVIHSLEHAQRCARELKTEKSIEVHAIRFGVSLQDKQDIQVSKDLDLSRVSLSKPQTALYDGLRRTLELADGTAASAKAMVVMVTDGRNDAIWKVGEDGQGQWLRTNHGAGTRMFGALQSRAVNPQADAYGVSRLVSQLTRLKYRDRLRMLSVWYTEPPVQAPSLTANLALAAGSTATAAGAEIHDITQLSAEALWACSYDPKKLTPNNRGYGVECRFVELMRHLFGSKDQGVCSLEGELYHEVCWPARPRDADLARNFKEICESIKNWFEAPLAIPAEPQSKATVRFRPQVHVDWGAQWRQVAVELGGKKYQCKIRPTFPTAESRGPQNLTWEFVLMALGGLVLLILRGWRGGLKLPATWWSKEKGKT